MTAKIPARGAILGYVISMIAMTLGIVVLPVAMAPVASAANPCTTVSAGTIYHTSGTKKVALTFDDGPSGNGMSSDWTRRIVDILRQNAVHATFFEIGEDVNSNPSMIPKILAGGNLIGNSTETHPNLTGLSEAGQAQEMDAATRALENAGAPHPCFFRAPGGNANSTTLSLAHARGMNLVYWSNDTLDWAAPVYLSSSYQDGIVSRATNPPFTNPIILMHDGSPGNYRMNTVWSLQRIIDFYQSRGYIFTDPLGNPFPSDNPIGHVDAANSPTPGMLRVAGWAFDPDQFPWQTPNVDIYINGVGRRITPNKARPDVQAAYPKYNISTPGFDLSTAAPTGKDRVTVYAINIGAGNNVVLWDGYVNVANPNPIGHADIVTSPTPGIIRVAGWAFDPNSPPANVRIHLYVNGVGTPKSTGIFRPDVKAAYPHVTNAGFDFTITVPAGRDRVTLYAINTGPGVHTVLWDGYVNVANPNPVGVLDRAYGPAMSHNLLRVTGWAFDPNAPTSQIRIHVYVNGVGTPRTTGVARPDVKAAYPQAGANTGFDITVPAPTGSDHVTVYAINVGPGSHTVLWDGHVTVS